MVRIEKQIFKGKQNIPWRPDVEQYLSKYINCSYVIESTGDVITIPKEFPDEYTGSLYTKSLRGGLAKTKANASQIIEELIKTAQNKRFVENKDEKHTKDASLGWFRYDTWFEAGVRGENESETRWNSFRATLVVRVSERGNYLYDIVNIKKEARRPLESN